VSVQPYHTRDGDVSHHECPVYGKAPAAEIYEGIMDGIPDLHLGVRSR
jgi:hypothetical protein